MREVVAITAHCVASPRLVAILGLLNGNFSRVKLFPLPAHFPLCFFLAVFSHFANNPPRVGKVGMEAQEIYTVTQRENVCFFVQFKPKVAYEPFNFRAAIL